MVMMVAGSIFTTRTPLATASRKSSLKIGRREIGGARRMAPGAGRDGAVLRLQEPHHLDLPGCVDHFAFPAQSFVLGYRLRRAPLLSQTAFFNREGRQSLLRRSSLRKRVR
jgi:hypothetical protein